VDPQHDETHILNRLATKTHTHIVLFDSFSFMSGSMDQTKTIDYFVYVILCFLLSHSFIHTYMLYSQLARCRICFLLFSFLFVKVECSDFFFSFVWKSVYKKTMMLLDSTMQNQSKHWYLDMHPLFLFSCTYIFNCSLSLEFFYGNSF
jgi:hypothetical protein